MTNAGQLKSENIDQLRLGLGVAVILGFGLAFLVAVIVGWWRLEGPVRQYPNSTAVGLPRFVVPNAQLSRCSSWTLIVDSTYATSDTPELVLTWYDEARRSYINQQRSRRSFGTRLEWGPLTFDLRRMPAISPLGNVTHISIMTNLQLKLCP